MDIEHHRSGNVLVVGVPEGTGRLTGTDIDEFIDGILDTAGLSITTIAFDMVQQEFLNSTGLGELIRMKDCLLDRNIEPALINLTPRVTSLIEMAGVDRFFSIVTNEDELFQR